MNDDNKKIQLVGIMEKILGGSVESWNLTAQMIGMFPEESVGRIKQQFIDEVKNYNLRYGKLQNPLGHLMKVLAEIGNELTGHTNAFQYDIYDPKIVFNIDESIIKHIIQNDLCESEKKLLEIIFDISNKYTSNLNISK